MWMLLGRSTSNRVKRFYEQDLGIVNIDFQSAIEESFLKDKSFGIHHQNIRRFFTEIDKVLHNIPTNIYSDPFNRNIQNLDLKSTLTQDSFN